MTTAITNNDAGDGDGDGNGDEWSAPPFSSLVALPSPTASPESMSSPSPTFASASTTSPSPARPSGLRQRISKLG